MDFIKQIVEGSAEMLAKILGKERDSKHELIIELEKTAMTDTHLLVFALLNERKINEAENLLFEVMKANPSWELIETGTAFYAKLEEFSDSELENQDFSRLEIEQGREDLNALYFSLINNKSVEN